jgi:serine/threonine-protein kinase
MTDPVAATLSSALDGRYRVEREIGAGGMATVYLAHDVRHDRRVALKVLRPELSAVVGAERFLQEIRLTANLQHPHILPLLDSGTVGASGLLFYVMPFVEGESLRERLRREKQLGIDDAVAIARAVAGALDYAHRRDVIHRDIKPENILLVDGQAVVADFGIALAVSHAGGSRMTETGLSVGTPQYMSPEQAMGERDITARSDIYSLGAVLYELLVGEPPFTGPTAQAIVAKVITERPPRLAAYRDTVPPHVDAAVRRALAKLPADRFATARDLAEALSAPRGVTVTQADLALDDGRVVAPPRAPRGRRLRSAVPWTAAGLFAGIAGWLGLQQSGTRLPDGAVSHFAIPLPPGTRFESWDRHLALSPAGDRIVLWLREGDTARLYTRRFDSLAFTPLRGTARAEDPAFSVDGRWVTFLAGGTKLKRVAVAGGEPTDVADSRWGNAATGADGTVYFTPTYLSGLWRVPPGGGPPEQLTAPDTSRRESGHYRPFLLRDARTVLFTNHSAPVQRSRIEALTIRTGERRVVVEGGVNARVHDGLLFFARGNAVLAAPLDERQMRLTAPPVIVLQGVAGSTTNGTASFAIADNGTLAFVPDSVSPAPRELVWVDRSGTVTPVLARHEVYEFPRLSPDGKRIAVVFRQEGMRDLWIYDLDRGVMQKLTNHQSSTLGAEWSPDGQQLFYPVETPVYNLFRSPADGSTPEEPVFVGPFDIYLSDLSRDGAMLLGAQGAAQGTRLVGIRLGASATLETTLDGERQAGHTTLSPDGRWVAYTSMQSGRPEIVVRSFPELSRVRHQVSTAGGEQPRWTRGGREIVYREADRMMAVSFDPASGRSTRPQLLFRGEYRTLGNSQTTYDVTPDGTRFLMVRDAPHAPEPHVIVVLNWLQAVRGRLRER